MVRLLIVDDEPMARARIRRLAERVSTISAIAEAADGIEALEQIAAFAPDVVYLDIDMPAMTGFDVLNSLETRPFAVVFQTAYQEFAVRAFEVNACDYILKPFSDERWAESLERALRRREVGEGALDGLQQHLHENQVYLSRFVIRSGARSHLIRAEDVRYFSSEEHTTLVHTGEQSYAYEHSLTFLEGRLDPRRFVRIHRNAIVNLDFVVTFSAGPEGRVKLRDGTEVRVSREKGRRLRELLEASR